MEHKNISQKVIELLASHLGVEPTDITEEDSLTQDLHMHFTDISDFLKVLEEEGIELDESDLSKIETVGDLIETLSETI